MNIQKNESTVVEKGDKIYYNIVMPYNPINGISYALFRQQLDQSIIERPSDYYLAVVRFQISSELIPILIPIIQPFPNVNLLNTIYSFTISYNGIFSPQLFLQFVTTHPNPPQSAPLTAGHPQADKTT